MVDGNRESTYCVNRPWRRYLQFRLRVLLCAVTLFAAISGAILLALKPYQDELAVRRQIQQAGGVTDVKYIGPECARRFLREGDLEVTTRAEYTEGDARRFLYLLRDLGNRELVRIAYADLSDADLQALQGKPYLQDVMLWHAPVSDAGLKPLISATELRVLSIGETHISDNGLKMLTALQNLEVLDLSNTRISDEGLTSLCELPQLRELSLAGTLVTDAGLLELAKIRTLEKLHLQKNIGISDRGVSSLAALPNLREVSLWDTKVTDDGVHDLQQARPNTLIRH